jgi:hypothetical protein
MLLYTAADPRVRALAALCPVIDPKALAFPKEMAEEFAGMLTGVSAAALCEQWQGLDALAGRLGTLSARPIQLVTGNHDELFPPSHYTAFAAALPGVEWVRHPDADHAFSTCRPWLVDTVTDWLAGRLGGRG